MPRNTAKLDYSTEVGRQFIHLTVIDLYEKNNRTFVKVLCICGTEKEFEYTKITRGIVSSCGCMKEKAKEKLRRNFYGPYKGSVANG